MLSTENFCSLLAGGSGVGKSAIISLHVEDLLKNQEIDLSHANFSARTSSEKTQNFIESKLERKAAGVYSASSSRKLFIFIDDVGMPGKDAFDSQPPIELLRQLIDSQGFYDRKKGFFKKISNFLIVSATGTSNLQDLSSRFMRHFHLFFISEPSSSVLLSLYSPVLSTHFEKIYPDPIRRSISTIIQSTVELYEKVVNKLKPTPSKFHYKYNLRDVGKVIQGITLATPNSLVTTDKLTKLWLHESSRVFFDRLTNPLDRVWFNKAASTTAMKYFKSGFLEDDWLETHPLQFSNIMNLDSVERIYEEIVDKKRIKRFVIDRLDDFNIRSRQKMPLEMFEEALAHVLHVCRGIYCPRGHMMLVGVGGSGKQSLAFLSSSILMFEPFSIQLIKGYNIENFHEDLKKLTRKSGVEGKPVSFVFSDQHMILDSFLEDLNSLINSGEVSDLYSEEEVEEIVNSLRSELVDHQGIEDSKETIYKEFINRVRDNLHILLCTSPVGSTLRNRCRMFPSFVNCSTIEWFDNWPEEALLSVATSKLSDLKIQIKSLANFASAIHLSAENEGLSFYKVLKRPAYVTPKLFFDFFEVFSKIFKKTSDNLWKKSTKLTNGLSKLNETRKIIAESQIKLQEMMPDLEIQKKRAENYYLEVQKETKAAVDLQVSVEKETEFIEIQFQDCKLKSDDAERDLAEATPILENALKAVQALEKNKSHIIEFKKYLKPPETIKMVMEAVCILLGERSDWNNAIVVLGQMDFLQRIVNYPKESVSNSTFKKLRIIVSKPEFQPEIVAQSSEAAKSLCIWCRAMFNYTEIFQIVKPKREKVFQMQAKLKSDMEKLESKQSELRSVEEKVNKLKDECAMTEQKVGTLEKDIKLTMDRVKRAELLLELLSEEGIKWQETVNQIQNYLKFVEVESMLNASVINYQGVFTDRFRSQLKEKTIILANHLQLPISDNYSFISTLGKPIEIREWQISGLPKDQTSQENSIIVMNSCKWPIIIDPQDQARRWLKNSFKKQNLVQLKPVKPGSKESKDVLRILESAVTSAKPVLFEDVGESQDSSLTNLLSRKFYKKDDGRLVIRLTDHEVMYDEGFFMVLQCRLSNPQFLPEVFGTLNVVNFTVTESGLEDQLLVEVVRLENPRLERERDDIIVSLAADQKLLEETQNAILDMIADSQGFILDNLNLISALQRSKSTSKDITRRVASTTQVENQVNLARDAFREIAIRGSVLFFVITSIPGINPMYQYSLAFYTKLFCSSIQSTASSSDRSSAIIENVTKTIFKVICRGLFEKDKKILAFLFAVAIWKNLKKISNETWKFFIRGAGLVAKKNAKKNPMSSVLNDLQWDFLCKLEKVSGFEGLADDFELRSREWTDFITDVLTKSPPGKYNLLDPFAKLLLVKALRPEKIMYAIDSFARAALGPFFSQVPPADLNSLFDESDKKTPIVFILSQGTDPVENILKITKDRGMSEKLVMISLGQGQGAKAQEAFDKSKAAGWWLLLQNCHLSRSWLPTLETLVDNLQEDSAGHRDFRVILTSMPSESFPVSILQNSLKVTTEPPSGLKSNISAVFSQVDTTSAEVPRPEIWKKMVFGVSFFHALTVERRKFGSLGFNIRYEFNDSDFITSIKLLKLLVEENEDVPWEGIQYIIGNINYGGRVTDKNDQVCLMAMFNKCCNAETLEENYFYTEDEVFKVPSQGDFLEYISSLPNVDPPEVFGMNINAQITLETQTSDSIIQCLIQTQPKEVSEDAADSDKMVHSMCKSLSNSLMDNMDLRAAHNDHLAVDSNGLIPSLSTFLFQEVEKFNRLLNKMRSSLKDLRNAIKGKVIMTEELSEMFSSLLNSSVPDMWKKVSYPSLKSLASWVADFNARVKFIYDWVKYGYQSCYWLSGFFFPQSFLTAVLQTHSRKYSLPIDSLVFTFEVTPWSFQEFRKNPADGVFIYGLFLEAARWDREEMILIDALEKEIYFTMPVIHFLPTNNYVAKEGDYLCPLYKTTSRAGILSSTGLSTNFVVYVDLSSEENPDKWTLLGVALLCQTND
jgi:dynein heavy chain